MHPFLAALLKMGLLDIQHQPGHAPSYQTYPALAQMVAQHAHGPYTMETPNRSMRYVAPIPSPIPPLEDISSQVRYQ